jgi:hypothetical protein
MFKPPDNWDELKTFSEIFKNLIEALAVIGGLFGLWKWLLERKDRATDILLQLEQEFRKPEIMKGRQCIEEIERYRLIKDRLPRYVAESQGERLEPPAESFPGEGKIVEDYCQAIDALLRFYVMLCGVREAKQVPERSLSTCFRYWLGHYHHPQRPEFKKYVDHYFPTLRKWLARDEKRRFRRKFFPPGDFIWPKP